MSNFIGQNEVNMANEPLKVSSEMDKLPCFTKTALIFTRHKIFRDGDKFSFSRLLSDGEFQLTDPRLAKIPDEVVEEVQKSVYWFLRSCRKTHFSRSLQEKSAHFCKDLADLHTSVKILQICMDLQDSVQRSLQNPAEKILQIFTDSQRLKTWVCFLKKFSVTTYQCQIVSSKSSRKLFFADDE